MNAASIVRKQKERNPEAFCASPHCLWRIVLADGSSDPCQNHPVRPALDLMDALTRSLAEPAQRSSERPHSVARDDATGAP